MVASNTILFALLGGVLPAIFWLWFWLQEDRLHPEPRSRVILVFLSGMITVLIVLPFEKLVYNSLGRDVTTLTIFLWALIEELFKYLAAYVSVLKAKELDEPIDAIIYLITVALGFSALENSLFISNLIDVGKISDSFINGNSRFLGATLLHTASSACIGVMMGLSYYRSKRTKLLFLLTGITLSVLLHSTFNLLIMKLEKELFFVFSGVWVLIISLILIIEKVKQVTPSQASK